MTDTPAKRNVQRVQMDLPPASFDRLNALKEKAEAATYTEVMKDALRLYEWFVDRPEGTRYFVEAPGGERTELVLFT
jgi:hypothetical protein